MEVILVLNAGSSSLKFQVLSPMPAWSAGSAARSTASASARASAPPTPTARPSSTARWAAAELPDLPAATEALRALALRPRRRRAPRRRPSRRPRRPRLRPPGALDADVLARLTALEPLAPLHQPHNLAAIRVVAAIDPDLPQVACFDTAFHRGHPEHTDCYALPRALYDEGIRRYGFHGLSYEYIAGRLPELAPEIAGGRVIVAHLGSGASMCALLAGRSVETRPWASPPSTACRWAPAPASSTPASSCT